MAQAQEIAKLYYTLDAKAGTGADAVLDDQIDGLEDLAAASEAAGLPIGQLRAAVAELVDGLEEGVDPAEAFGEVMANLAEVTEEVLPALQAQVQLYSRGAQVTTTRAESLQRLADIENILKRRLAEGNLTLERRIGIERLLAQTQGAAIAGQARAAGALTSTVRVAKEGGTAVKAFGDRWGQATLQIVDAAANVANAGQISGRSLKGLLVGATSLIGVIGTGGALVTAAGIGAQALISIFTKAREEARKATDDMIADITRMQNAGAFTELQDKLQNIWTGTAEKNFEDGLGFIRERIAKLDYDLKRTDLAGGGFGIARQIEELKKQEKPLTEAFERIRKVILESPVAPVPRRRAAIEVGADSDEKLAREAEQRAEANRRLADAFRDVQQGFDDLLRNVIAGEDPLDRFDKAVRELTDRFHALKAPTEAQVAAFEEMTKKATEARATLRRLEADKAAKEFRALQASMTTTQVDDLNIALDELVARLEKLRADGVAIDPAKAQELLDIQRELIRATGEQEALDARIAEIQRTKISNFDAQLALQDLLLEKEEALAAVTGEDEVSRRRTLALEAQIAKLKATIAALAGKASDDSKDAATSSQKWASYLESAASAAFGIASALTGADSSITRMLGATVQMVSGFQQIADLASKAGGFASLFSSAGGIASALPGLGALVGGGIAVASLFRGQKTPPSPEQQELIRIQKANNQRLADLKLSLDKAAKFSVGGGLVAAVRDVALTEQRPITDGVLGGSGLTSEVGRSVTAVLAELKRLGVGIEELRSIAQDAGIELSDNPTLDQIKALQEYLQTQTLASLFSGLEGKLRKLELAAQLDPEAFDGIPGIMARLKILTGADGIPAIAEALAGLDPASPTYLQDVIAALTQLGLTADQLDLSKLGGLSPDEFLAEIIKLVTGIRTATPAAKTATEKFAAAMEAYNTQLEFGTITTAERLDLARAKFKELFPALADSIDLSSVEAFEASIQSIIDGFAADGELTDAEKAQIAVLEQVREAFRGAASEAEKFVDALSVLATEFDLFDTSFSDQFKRLRDEGVKKFADSFPGLGDLFAGIDFDTPEGRATLAERFREWFAAAAADGLTEEENAIAQWFRDILGIGEQIADEEARKAEELLREAQAKRDGILQAAEDYIEALDIDDPVEQFIIRANAIKRAFPGLTAALEQFDLATEEGRAAFEAWVESLFSSPEKLQAAADAAGLTLEQFIEAILGLEAASDNATARVRTLGEALDEAFSEVDFGVALEGITDPIERLVRTANAAIGVDAKIRDALGGLDLRTEEGRKAAEAALVQLGQSTTDRATRDAILRILDGIRGITPTGAPGEVAAGRTADPTREDTSRAQFVAEDVRFAQLLDYSSRTAIAVEGMLALLSARGPLIAPPVLPPQAATAAAIFGGASALAAGQVSAERGAGLSVAITLTFPGTVYLGSEEQAREILTPAIVEALLQASGRQLQVDRQLRGKGTR